MKYLSLPCSHRTPSRMRIANRFEATLGFLIRKIAPARILVSDRLPRASSGKIYELLEFAKIFYTGSRIRSGPSRGRTRRCFGSASSSSAADDVDDTCARARERERERVRSLPFSISTVTDPSDGSPASLEEFAMLSLMLHRLQCGYSR